jgi:hypothetical protein
LALASLAFPLQAPSPKKTCNHEVLLIDQSATIGSGISSRNSKVIHAGIYYDSQNQSLKSKLCMEGNRLLYEYCMERSIAFRNCGKLLVSTDSVEIRLGRAMEQVESADGIKTLAVVGGVAANKELRSRLNALCSERSEPWEMFVPPPRLCTDQGSMSAWAAIERLMVGSSDLVDDQIVYAKYSFSLSADAS